MKKVIMTLALAAGIAACFAQSDSVVRQYKLPSPRITHEVRKEEPKTPSQALRELVSQPTQYGSLQLREKWLALRARSHEGKPRRA